jgi:hypothetical protein
MRDPVPQFGIGPACGEVPRRTPESQRGVRGKGKKFLNVGEMSMHLQSAGF